MNRTVDLWSEVANFTLHDEDELRAYSGSLYHYTNSAGLAGILTSQRIWGTNSAYLNDSTEFSYGLDVARSVLDSAVAAAFSPMAALTLDATRALLQTTEDEIYVASLSEDGDLLSQWKGYGAFGAGYAIELDASQLLRTHRKHPNFQICIRKVIYDRAAQELMFGQLLTRLSKFIYDDQHDEYSISDTSRALAHLLRFQSLFCKHPAFREEREWRVAIWNRPSSEIGSLDIKFRVAGDFIVPYVCLDIGPSAQKATWHLPISGIIAGSRVDLVRAQMSIRLLCGQGGFPVPQLKPSTVPLR